ncbi:hypothetical protein BJF78_02490 [Pseudonocardia sp. CNS-139]|nr:hypothetical protein BJF78_02490 [Pseudonocardia sp. CNS-139]
MRVFLRAGSATAALRVGAVPLHRRAYKQRTGPGTLHPPVAAALARLAGPVASVLDPFCGDGTIAVEAALAHPDARVLASDADPERVRHAAANAAAAGVAVDLAVADAAAAPATAVDAVVTNPPWNLAVDATGALNGSLAPFWRRLPDLLTAGGRLVALTEAALDVPAVLRDLGCTVPLADPVRIAGRVAHVVLAAPPGRPAPDLLPGAARWRTRARRAGATL